MFHTYIHLSSEAYVHALREEQQYGKDRNSLWNLGVAFATSVKQAHRHSANFLHTRHALRDK